MKRIARARHHPQALCALAAVYLAGCAGPQNYLDPAGPGARGLAWLGWWGLAVFSVASAVIWLLLAWIAVRRRGTFDEHAPADATGGQRWILIGGIAIPMVVLTVLLVAGVMTLSDYPMAHAKLDEPDIRVTGHQWWFDVEYLPGGSICTTDAGDLDLQTRQKPLGARADQIVHSPSEIHIPIGRPIEIELITRDVIHSFWIPKLHGKVDLIPGQANRIRIQADKAGVYQGQCAEFCGIEHANMRMQVVADSAIDYVAWLNRQRADAIASRPSDEIAAGKKVFESAACALCHTVRGTPAHGQVGPELTHVGSRRRIAGGMLDNNTANLSAWVTSAQSLKPGAEMPDLTQFTGDELRSLVAYLQSLK